MLWKNTAPTQTQFQERAENKTKNVCLDCTTETINNTITQHRKKTFHSTQLPFFSTIFYYFIYHPSFPFKLKLSVHRRNQKNNP